jgi:hypothetical protein
LGVLGVSAGAVSGVTLKLQGRIDEDAIINHLCDQHGYK